MTELVFPLAALLLTFLIVIPILTVISARVLRGRRRHAESWVEYGSDSTFALLVAPVLVPIVWLGSAALHQVEAAREVEPCFNEHGASSACVDSMLLLAALAAGVVGLVVYRLLVERSNRVTPLPAGECDQIRRLESLRARHPRLRGLRVQVVRHGVGPVLTRGLLRPVVMLDESFMRGADDSMLVAALLHERAHVAGRDTLRGFILRLCQNLNPAWRWLSLECDHWLAAREALCDQRAVHEGGDRLALAESIMKAARFAGCDRSAQTVGLCGHDTLALKLRLNLLLGEPGSPRRSLGYVVLATALAAVVVAPHWGGAGALEHFHIGVERLLHTLP